MRDSLGLTYDVSFELSQFDRLRTGYFVVHVTSTPAKIRDALAASVDVLRSFHGSPVTQRELERAQRTLLTRHESDLKVHLKSLAAWPLGFQRKSNVKLERSSAILHSAACKVQIRPVWPLTTMLSRIKAIKACIRVLDLTSEGEGIANWLQD